MRNLHPVLIASLLLTACQPGARPDNVRRSSGQMDLSYVNLSGSGLTEGELAVIEIRITNDTNGYVLLRELDPADDMPPVSWQESRPGRIEYVPGANAYVFDSEAEGRTAAVFNGGLLAPGESIVFRMKLRLLNLPKVFTLRFQKYTLQQLSSDVYFAKPAVEGRREFLPLSGDDLRKRLIPNADIDRQSHRMVLFPYHMSREAENRILDIRVPYRKRAFTLEEAGRKIDVTRGRVRWTYFAAMKFWVIQKENRCWLVGPEETHEVAPARNPEAFYQFLDATYEKETLEVEFRDEPYAVLPGEVRLVKTVRGGRERWVGFVPRRRWVAFLEQLREYDLVVDVEPDIPVGRILVERRKDD